MKVTLYRAGKAPDAGQGISFSPNIEVAEAYLDNPGFGGATLYQYQITTDEDSVLRTYGQKRPLQKLAESVYVTSLYDLDEPWNTPAYRKEEEWRQSGFHKVYEVLLNDKHAEEDARKFGYEWVTFDDDFPNIHPPPETWWKLYKKNIKGKPVRTVPEVDRRAHAREAFLKAGGDSSSEEYQNLRKRLLR